MNRQLEDRNAPHDESTNSIVEVFCDDCEAFCYEMLNPSYCPTNCVYDDALQQYKMMLQKVYMELTNKDLLISDLRGQQMKMENYCRNSLQEIKKLRIRYQTAVQELENLKKQYVLLDGQKIEEGNSSDRDRTVESIMKTEIQRWNNENKEIQRQIQSMNSDIQSLIRVVTNETKKTVKGGPRNHVDPIEQLVTNQSAILTLLASRIEGNVKAIESTNHCFIAKCRESMDRTEKSAVDLKEKQRTENFKTQETQTVSLNELQNSTAIISKIFTVSENDDSLVLEGEFEKKIVKDEERRDLKKIESEISKNSDNTNENTLTLIEDIVETKFFSPLDAEKKRLSNEKKIRPVETMVEKKCYCGNTELCPEYIEKSEEYAAIASGCVIQNTAKSCEVTDDKQEKEQSIDYSKETSERSISSNELSEEVDSQEQDSLEGDEIVDTVKEKTVIVESFTPVSYSKPPDTNEAKPRSNSKSIDTQNDRTYSVEQQVEQDVLDVTFHHSDSAIQVEKEQENQTIEVADSQLPVEHEVPECCRRNDAKINNTMGENLIKNDSINSDKICPTEVPVSDLDTMSSIPEKEIASETEQNISAEEYISEEIQPVKKVIPVEHCREEKKSEKEPDIPPFFEEFFSTVTNEIEDIKTIIANNDLYVRSLKEDFKNLENCVLHENARLLEKIQSSINDLPNRICNDSVFNEMNNNLREVKQITKNFHSMIDEINYRFKSIESLDKKEVIRDENMKLSVQCPKDDTEMKMLKEILDKMKNLENFIFHYSEFPKDGKQNKYETVTKCNCKNKKTNETMQNNDLSSKRREESNS